MKKIDIPIVVEPGSQPADEDGVVLDYMPMPKGVWTYAVPRVPEPEEVEGLEEGVALLARIEAMLREWAPGSEPLVIELDHLNDANRALVDQVLGDGEVSVIYEGPVRARMQESVLAGVWRVQYLGDDDVVERDVIEIGVIPSLVRGAAFDAAAESVAVDGQEIPDGVGNAAPILVEIADQLEQRTDDSAPHVINLTLLPCTDADIEFLTAKLGGGPAVILSRGYGNCRITSTATRNVWWVQYFNSQDKLILNSIEVSRVPAVACAAREDIEDSADRMREILEVYQ